MKATANGNSILTTIPCNDREVVGGGGPLQFIRLLLEFLEFHCQLTLAYFIIWETLEVRSQTEPRHAGNEPFGRVVLIPFDGITIVHWELMVKVVVPFADGDESGEDVVTRSVLVIEWALPEVVSERIDTEC